MECVHIGCVTFMCPKGWLSVPPRNDLVFDTRGLLLRRYMGYNVDTEIGKRECSFMGEKEKACLCTSMSITNTKSKVGCWCISPSFPYVVVRVANGVQAMAWPG